jgi:hypothetical protein
MGRDGTVPADLDRSVVGAVQAFFQAHRNARWMPTRLVQANLPDAAGRRVREALTRLTASGHVERADRRPGNPVDANSAKALVHATLAVAYATLAQAAGPGDRPPDP